jgi:hypothetical protein
MSLRLPYFGCCDLIAAFPRVVSIYTYAFEFQRDAHSAEKPNFKWTLTQDLHLPWDLSDHAGPEQIKWGVPSRWVIERRCNVYIRNTEYEATSPAWLDCIRNNGSFISKIPPLIKAVEGGLARLVMEGPVYGYELNAMLEAMREMGISLPDRIDFGTLEGEDYVEGLAQIVGRGLTNLSTSPIHICLRSAFGNSRWSRFALLKRLSIQVLLDPLKRASSLPMEKSDRSLELESLELGISKPEGTTMADFANHLTRFLPLPTELASAMLSLGGFGCRYTIYNPNVDCLASRIERQRARRKVARKVVIDKSNLKVYHIFSFYKRQVKREIERLRVGMDQDFLAGQG